MSFERELADREEDWQVMLLAPTDEHRLAVAVVRHVLADLADTITRSSGMSLVTAPRPT